MIELNNNANLTLNINDNFTMKDAIDLAKKLDRPYLKGHVVLRDPVTGEILREGDNLILLRGRAYVLELLFGLTVNANTGYKTSHNRTVQLFNVGNGSADINNSPFEVTAPKFNNTGLYNPIPFVIEDPNKNIDPEKKSNPSIVKTLSDAQKKVYYMSEESVDGSVSYYAKKPEANTARLIVNQTTNACYWNANLLVSKTDCRGNFINEIGLLLCRYNSSTNKYEDIEQFSHFTFETISLSSLQRGVLISYSVYA